MQKHTRGVLVVLGFWGFVAALILTAYYVNPVVIVIALLAVVLGWFSVGIYAMMVD